MKSSTSLAYLLLSLTVVSQAATADSVPVTEQDTEAELQDVGPSADRSTDEITADQLNAEFMRVRILLAERAFDEADSVAKRAIELAIRLKGPRSDEMAKALTNLGVVQHYTKQYDAAQQNFQAAVEIIEDIEDRLNSQLVNPLQGLAAAQLESGRPDLASNTYNRAVHVTHVNEGPHNLDQLELLESLEGVHVRLGLTEEADDIQETIYALNTRHYENGTLEVIPALMKRARWQPRIC